MGKLLRLGSKLRYPLTIGKLLKNPGDEIRKQEPIMQFKFTWKQKVGDPFGDEWEADQTTIADWDSPADGCIQFWKVQEGMVIEKDIPFVEIEESCPHSVQFAGLCGICGKDMTEVTWASASDDTGHANINMIHNKTTLTVSEDEASKAEEELQRRLLRNRKLSLVVDLDQTIIHACIEPTVGEWQNDPTNPNYPVVKEVSSFQLNDDGSRGMVTGFWYYIKKRPGLKDFLDKISEKYELHVYTMGTRAYAMNVAKIVDPDKRLFGDRIISRDENGSITTKSLSRLFPVNTKMVVIIDDRADVWPNNRPNLIKVVPYDFFLGVGDINSSFLPKRQDISNKKNIKTSKEAETPETAEITPPIPNPSLVEVGKNDIKSDADENKLNENNAKVSALEDLVRMGGGENHALRLEQTAEQEKLLEKQMNERPLLHMQEELERVDQKEESHEPERGQSSQYHNYHRQNLLKDDDDELVHLEKHLIQLHQEFYREYDSALSIARDRMQVPAPENPQLNEDMPDLKIIPDIGNVMPRLKAKTLAGCVIVTSGLVPLQTDILKTELGLQAMSFGAKISYKVNKHTTHLVVSINRIRTCKVRQASKYPHIKIVNQDWLMNSISKWKKEDEKPYLICIEEDNLPHVKLHEIAIQPSDESDSSLTCNENDGLISVTSRVRDSEKVKSSEANDGDSSTHDFGSIDWGEIHAELAEFMEDGGSENDSDASNSTGLKKRTYEEVTDGEDTQIETALPKKQKLSNERKTGLYAVDTPQNKTNSRLPTPLRTSDEETIQEDKENIGGDNESDLDTDMEVELFMAEWERQDEEEVARAKKIISN